MQLHCSLCASSEQMVLSVYEEGKTCFRLWAEASGLTRSDWGAQHAAGGLAGLVFAMLMEAVLLIIRTTVPYELPPKRRKVAPARPARPQGVDQQSAGAGDKMARGPGAPSRRRTARRDRPAAFAGDKKDQ